ncbi:MAG: YtxH domain-containing protein [Thermomicrobiales bacterium]
MTEQRHTAAFVVGAILGGIAGAAATLWTTPKSGAQLRAELIGAVESAVLRVTEVGERGREALSAISPLPTAEPETGTATTPIGDVRVSAEPAAAGPAVFPSLVDFAPPGVDVERPPESTRPAPPA